MIKYFLFLGILILSFESQAAEQVYFKVAVDNSTYTAFMGGKAGLDNTTLNYLASKMRNQLFKITDVDKAYYDIAQPVSMRFAGRDVLQYDLKPRNADRFRQMLMVDSTNEVVHKDVYDPSGKLVYSFTILESEDSSAKPVTAEGEPDRSGQCFLGFCVIGKRMLKDGTSHIMLSDGMNKFSIFKKRVTGEVSVSKKIVYGNYVMRKKQGDDLYTVVGTIPYSAMQTMIENYSKLEE
jgi:sigma-E factor negative regulatory protein RseB